MRNRWFDISSRVAACVEAIRGRTGQRLTRRPDLRGLLRHFGHTRRRQASSLICLGLAGILLGGCLAAWREPSWYTPPVIQPDQRQQVRNSLIAAEQAFTERLRAGGPPFVYHLHQDDLNRWVTMRREIYPLIDELLPPQLGAPFILFDTNRILVAGRYRLGPIEVVASMEITPAVRDEALVLTASGLRCGSVGVPIRLVESELSRPTSRPAGKTWPGSPWIAGDLRSGLRLGTEAWWKNGGIDYRVLEVQATPGRLSFTIQPLGRHHEAAGPKDQASARRSRR